MTRREKSINWLPNLVHNLAPNLDMNKEQLIEALVNRIIDDMDTKSLRQLASDYLESSYEKYTEEQLLTEMQDRFPELLES